ncbi:hypothetical protein ALC53_06137 [Atta colombica]|uniref:Uncharacterized protein n=1 Tax=Atta colombica TaxID=520822 RepID=A0A195BFP5_9HYME|nr:hypothetical protein ALC53_06137 [Atta colombica]
MRYKEARSCIIRPTCALHLVCAWATNCGKLPRKSGNRAVGCEAQAACRDGTIHLAILQVIIRTDATGGFPVEREHFHVTLQFSRFDDASEEEENRNDAESEATRLANSQFIKLQRRQVHSTANNGWRGIGNATSAFYESLSNEQGYRTAYANKYDRTTLFYAKRVTAVTSSGRTMRETASQNTSGYALG